MRVTSFLLVAPVALVACGGASSTPIDDLPNGNGDKSSSSSSSSSSSGGSSGSSGATCPGASKQTRTAIGDGPAPPPPLVVTYDVTNKSGQVLYVVNDDGEREMLEVTRGAAPERLTPPPALVCGANLTPIHDRRFLFAVAPGETRSIIGWNKTVIAPVGKACTVCANQGRPDLGVELNEQYSSADAASGTYTVAVKLLESLPPECTAVGASGFTCPGWPGAAALAGRIRTSKISVPVANGPRTGEEHVAVSF